MIKLLLFVLIPVLILGGLGYWRYTALKPDLTTPSTQAEEPIEVPKQMPQASLEDRVKNLETVVTKLATQVNNLKSPAPASSSAPSSSSLDAQVTELKARVSALEKADTAPASSNSQSVVYIPLGSGGGPWGDKGWFSLNEYQITLDPVSYPGYTGMVLEVTFRLTAKSGTASIRLYNSTDSSATSSQVDTTSDSLGLFSTSSFKLASGSKTYNLQVKSSEGQNVLIQFARIKVTF